MIATRTPRHLWWGVALALLMAPVLSAQETTYLGTVTAVEPARVQVRTVDEKTKREQHLWFAIDKDTTVKRGDGVVTLADAKIAQGERIAVIVDPASKTKMLAMEIRLAPVQPDPPRPASAQPPPAHAGHAMGVQQPMPSMQMGEQQSMHMAPAWHFMEDGVVLGLFNSQGGPRGGKEFVVPNWWMGMLVRQNGNQQFGLNAMLSLDPATVGKDGYRELFQVGEALDGKPLIDRQHPHDLFMQLAASWRTSLGDKTALIIAGGPAGEPTLGPVAFMHRQSAGGLVMAPLGHHTFDSTHISFGVITAALERGRWVFEGSVFNGREPDEDRWDFDFGPMDSVAGRVWFRPTPEWALQVSSGLLREPEALEPGDIRRTTASVSWSREHDASFNAVTAGYGVNGAHGARRHGVFGEFTSERPALTVFGRLEFQQVETGVLLTGVVPDASHAGESRSTVTALTAGAARRFPAWRGFEGALGTQVTFYGVPELLRATHGERPVSFQVFLRVRLPSGDMGRMWNMLMSQGQKMPMHSGHTMGGDTSHATRRK